MDFLKPLEFFTLGVYSAAGAAAMIALYLLFYGARCLDAWRYRQPMPTDRVLAHVVIAAVLGLVAGSFAQGMVDLYSICTAYGQPAGPCLFKQIIP